MFWCVCFCSPFIHYSLLITNQLTIISQLVVISYHHFFFHQLSVNLTVKVTENCRNFTEYLYHPNSQQFRLTYPISSNLLSNQPVTIAVHVCIFRRNVVRCCSIPTFSRTTWFDHPRLLYSKKTRRIWNTTQNSYQVGRSVRD